MADEDGMDVEISSPPRAAAGMKRRREETSTAKTPAGKGKAGKGDGVSVAKGMDAKGKAGKAGKAGTSAAAAAKATPAKKPAAKAKPAAKKAAAKKAPAKKAAAKGKGKGKAAAESGSGSDAESGEEEEGEEEEEEEEGQDEDGEEAPKDTAEEPEDAGLAKPSVAKKAKDMKPMEMVEMAMKAYKWWEEPALTGGVKWRYMEHRGVCFPPAYKPHGVKMLYDGHEVDLTPEQEEMATFFASVAKDAPQLSNPKTAKVFCKNFFTAFREVLGKDHKIQKFELCDFDPIREHLEKRKEIKKAMSKEDKEREKADKAATQLTYGFALVDTHIEKMGNYTVEPPGLFRGRGLHPKMGTLKRRVLPEDIVLNLGSDAVVPPCPIPGHNWRRVVHDPTVAWLAYWKESVMGNTKYVALAASSSFKGKSDRDKYEKARRLKKHIDKIRAHYEKLLQSDDDFERQSGTAMWVIDRLALRVGGEKDEDEADTVGCCSLRVEHLTFPSDHEVTLDFLGKDSMRYFQTIDFERYGPIGKLVLKNLRRYWKDKKKDEDLFDRLTPSRLNEQFNALMPGLSAKVFRTYNASVTLEHELEDLPLDTPMPEKVLEYNRANREVAILCNHQRTVPKAFEKTWEKLTLKEALLLQQVEELRAMRTKLAKGEKIRLKSETPAAAKKTSDAAGKADEDADGAEDEAAAAKRLAEEEAHLFSKQPSIDDLERRLTTWEEKLDKLRIDMRNKDENKAVALGTSKINYMDPRITVAWCKRVALPIEKVFPKTLVAKFNWAMDVPSSWTF